jgi:large subunit ribosomal protein L25
MEDVKLIAKKRDLQGSSNSRRLRKSGSLPGVIYSEGGEATAVQLNTHDFEQVLHHHSSESVIVEVSVEGAGDITALVQEVQHHPVSSDLIHVDLLKVDANVAIHVEIPVEVVGEAEGVKAGGSLELVLHNLLVECLPGDLAEYIEVDVSALEIGDVIHVSDITVDAKLKLIGDEDAIILTVAAPRVESEDDEDAEEGAVVGAEPEVINEKKADEGAE